MIKALIKKWLKPSKTEMTSFKHISNFRGFNLSHLYPFLPFYTERGVFNLAGFVIPGLLSGERKSSKTCRPCYQLQSIASWRRAVWKGSFQRKDRSNSRKEPLFTSPQNPLARNDLIPPSFPFVTMGLGVLVISKQRGAVNQQVEFPNGMPGHKDSNIPLSLADY